MASLTIRKLDDAIKTELRLRAARHGRSVEDEVRVILREAGHSEAEISALLEAKVAFETSEDAAPRPEPVVSPAL